MTNDILSITRSKVMRVTLNDDHFINGAILKETDNYIVIQDNERGEKFKVPWTSIRHIRDGNEPIEVNNTYTFIGSVGQYNAFSQRMKKHKYKTTEIIPTPPFYEYTIEVTGLSKEQKNEVEAIGEKIRRSILREMF